MRVKKISNRAIGRWLKQHIDVLEELILDLSKSPLPRPKRSPLLQRFNSLEESIDEGKDPKFLIKECAYITKEVFEDFLNMNNLPEPKIGSPFLFYVAMFPRIILDKLFPSFAKRARSFYHPLTKRIVIKLDSLSYSELIEEISFDMVHEYTHYLYRVLPARKGGSIFEEGLATTLTDLLCGEYGDGSHIPLSLGCVYNAICLKIGKQPINVKIYARECAEDGREKIVYYDLIPGVALTAHDFGRTYFTLLQKKYGNELYERILKGDETLDLLPTKI